jgi:hypothetical protein
MIKRSTQKRNAGNEQVAPGTVRRREECARPCARRAGTPLRKTAEGRRIGHLKLLFARAPRDASPAPGGRLPQQRTARRGGALRGLDRRLKMGYGRASRVSWRQGLGMVRWEKLGRGRLQTGWQGAKGRQTPPRRARLRRRSASARFPPPTQWRKTGPHIGERDAAVIYYQILKQLAPRHPLTKHAKRLLYPPFWIRILRGWADRLAEKTDHEAPPGNT